MLKQKCYYLTETTNEYKSVTFSEMKELEKSHTDEFYRRKIKLYWEKNDRIPMVIVRKGSYVGFRRKGNVGNGDHIHTRSVNESSTHYGNKDALQEMKQLRISFFGTEVLLYIEEARVEEPVECNGRKYEIDLYLKLSKTDPAEYCDKWGGELWFEIYCTCRVDSQQAEDFVIENKTLFEYKVPDSYNFFDNLSEESYLKRKKSIQERYKKEVIKGLLICENHDMPLCKWKKSPKGNMTACINGSWYTISQNRDKKSYAIIYGKGIVKRSYNGRIFETEKEAMKIAEHLAFLIYNNYDLKRI